MEKRPIQILIVEDDDAQIELMRRSFMSSSKKINLNIAQNLQQARAVLSETNPDLVIVDYVLPDGKGIELLHGNMEEFSFPVVIITSQGDEQIAVESFKKGAFDYIVKSNEIFAGLPNICERVLREWDKHIKLKQVENELRMKNSFLRILQVAAVAANNAVEIQDAFKPVLNEICRHTGWPFAHAYILSENNPELLEPIKIWYFEKNNIFDDFCNITKTTKYLIGEGLPGRVLASGKPHWIVDVTKDTDFVRAEIAKETGIKSGFAFPVMIGTEVVAVLEFFGTKAEDPDKTLLGIVADVGRQLGRVVERKRSEDLIKASLKEKNTLLGEIHHRVKNNLQVISSLLNLQSDNVKDKGLRTMFKETQDRIKSMALVHEELYHSKDLSEVDFSEYVRILTGRLLQSYDEDPDNISIKTTVDNIFLDVDKAIPCGLIINELFSNSLKYAFPTDTIDAGKSKLKNEIEISMRRVGKSKIKLSVRDNGIGLPEDLDIHNTTTLGMQLVSALTEQLEATIELIKQDGTEFEIIFGL